jgi:2-methylcitrate synthase
MKAALAELSRWAGDPTWIDIERVLERIMVDEKCIYPNLDFPAGPSYYLMGFPIDLYTPIFVVSRITGWTAHVFEQSADNRLIRPLSAYVGQGKRAVRPLAER